MSEKNYTKISMLMRFLEGCKGMFAAAILSSALVSGLDMVTPQIIRVVVDYCLDGRPEVLPAAVRGWLEAIGGRTFVLQHLYLAALGILVIAGLQAVFRYLNAYLNTRATERMMKTARDLLFRHIGELPFDWHMKNKTGDIIQRCTSDVNTVREFVSEQLVQVVRIVILILFSVIFMVMMSVKLSLIVFVSVPVLILFSYIFYLKVGHLFRECDENEGVLSAIAQENLTGVRVVRAFGRENAERERFGKQNRKYTDTWMALCRILSVYWAAGDLLTALQIMLIVVIGSVLCVRGEMSAGGLIAFVSYNRQLIWPVRRLGRMLSDMSKAGVSMDRLLYILNSPAESWPGDREPDMTGDIEAEHVTFGYDGKEILKDVSFTVPGGSTLGILGATGSGKTTLMHLLNGLYPVNHGEIRIGGVPVREISLPWLRRHIGIVLQEPYLFSRTLEENITIAGSRDHQAVESAVRIAALTESVNRFARGYETMVGERGVTLSGGQKQRTAIARMLVQDTPIMIFDDSLSAVDAETDEKIRHGLKEVMGKKTVILISHRISTLKEADQILVLEEGRIRDRGTHKELLSRPGLYRRIYEIQAPEETDTVFGGGANAAAAPDPEGTGRSDEEERGGAS